MLSTKLYTDTLFYDDTSVQGNNCTQLYSKGGGFIYVYMMRYKAGAGDSLGNLVKDIGIMN